MDKRHNLKILGLTMFTLAGLSLAHSAVNTEKAADATAQAGRDLKGNPQMTMPVTKAEKKAEKKEMKAEKKAKKEAEKAKKKADKKDMKAKEAMKVEEKK